MRCVKFIRCPIWLQSMLSNANPIGIRMNMAVNSVLKMAVETLQTFWHVIMLNSPFLLPDNHL